MLFQTSITFFCETQKRTFQERYVLNNIDFHCMDKKTDIKKNKIIMCSTERKKPYSTDLE